MRKSQASGQTLLKRSASDPQGTLRMKNKQCGLTINPKIINGLILFINIT